MPTPDIKEMFTWPFAVFCLGVYFFTFILRRVAEASVKKLPTLHIWNEVVLPLLPPVFGGIAAVVMYKYPFLDKLPTWGTRAFFGVVGGGFSGLLYRAMKVLIKRQFGVDLSNPPPANPDQGA